MTKNEEILIEDWIKYHGFLFGFQNIHIIDGSDNQQVLDIYEKYRQKGLNVHYSNANLNEMKDVLNDLMHKHKGENNFLIKLDTDEFLAHISPYVFKFLQMGYFLGNKLRRGTTNFNRIMHNKYVNFLYARHRLRSDGFEKIFGNLPITGQKYKTSFTAISVPANNDIKRPCREITSFKPIQFSHFKSFFHSESFRSVDLGGHNGVTTNNEGVIDTPLTVIHFHSISIKDTLRRARQVLISHKYIDEDDDIERCKNKLLKLLESNHRRNSFHRINWYLAYIDSIQNNTFLPHALPIHCLYQSTNSVIKIDLVKDTLAAINQMDDG